MNEFELQQGADVISVMLPPAEQLTASWLIGFTEQGMSLTRLHHGRADASYRMYTQAETPVVLAAIAQGFEPPRRLAPLDPIWQDALSPGSR